MKTQILIFGLVTATISSFGQYRERREENREEKHVERVEVRRTVRVDRDMHRGPVREIPVTERARYYGYRVPVRRELIWDAIMLRDFRLFYPEIVTWRYATGYRVPVIPAYEAYSNIGEVGNVYGRVVETYYDNANDQYYLYFGEPYPNHIFSIIIPGPEARYLNPRPDIYFNGQHVTVTGYITNFDNRPEIIIRKARQIQIY